MVAICSRLLVDVIDPFRKHEEADNRHDDRSSRAAKGGNNAGYGASHGHTNRTNSQGVSSSIYVQSGEPTWSSLGRKHCSGSSRPPNS